jgi:7-keto-8-aminopelargonate synthetase-like enzyme/acyl-CoA synthetase (AMP-forming)/AMP-acid ligase II/acyl carrier protein
MTTPMPGGGNGSARDAPARDLLRARSEPLPTAPPPERRGEAPADSSQNLVELLRWRARHQPDQRAFTFLLDGETTAEHLTYAALDRQARTIAAHLQRVSDPGDRALLLYPTGLPYIAAFFGCLYAGVIAVPAYPPTRRRSLSRLRTMLAEAQPACALTTSALQAEIVKHDVEQTLRTSLGWLATDALVPGAWQEPSVTGDTLAFLQYTSGSTASPRGVMVSHGNVLHNERLMRDAFRHAENTVVVGWVPLYHDMGLIGNVLHAVYLGVPSILMAPLAFLQKPVRWLRAITRYRATTSCAPNFGYKLCVRTITREQRVGLDLSSWAVAISGAEPVQADSLQRFGAAFASCGFRREAFYPCYGLAEATLFVSGVKRGATPVVHVVDARALEQHRVSPVVRDHRDGQPIVSCGQPAGDQRVVVVDPVTCRPCAADRVGELWVAGASVAGGYWQRPEETAETFRAVLADTGAGPFLRTGDLGFVLDGEVCITGRLKDLLILRGQNHYPHDIEWTVERSHRALRPGSGAAFTVDVEGEEQLIVAQEVERGALRTVDVEAVAWAIRRAVAERHALQVHAVVLLGPRTLPRTSSGKVRRHACRAAFVAGRLDHVGMSVLSSAAMAEDDRQLDRATLLALAPADRPPVLTSWLRALVAAGLQVNSSRIAAEEPLGKLGIDSLAAVGLRHRIEARLGAVLTPDAWLQDLTVAQLATELATALDGTGPAQNTEATPGPQVAADLFAKCEGDGGYFGAYRVQRDEYFSQPILEGPPGARMRFNGKDVIVWSLNNYLGLAGHERIRRAARTAVEEFGTAMPMGSRLLTGNTALHVSLEERLARFCQKPAALVFNYGYLGVLGTMAALVQRGDLVVIDSLSHASIVDGAVLASAGRPFRVFRHNDMDSLEAQLRTAREENTGGILVVTEGVFGMSGDLAPLASICQLSRQYGARLLVDDAHGFGVMGPEGRGTGEHFQVQGQIDLYFGTFAKAFAAIGGVTAGDEHVVDYVRYNARPHVFAKSLPLVFVAAIGATLELIEHGAALRRRMWRVARQLQQGLVDLGFDIGRTRSPITPVYVPAGSESTCLAMMRMLRDDYGVFVSGVTYPVVPAGTLLLRLIPTAVHTAQDVDQTLAAFRATRDRLRLALPSTPRAAV